MNGGGLAKSIDSTVPRKPRGECGRYEERPIVADAAETMNLQAAGLDLLKAGAQLARTLRTKADDIERELQRYALAHAAHRDSVARHERKAVA